LLTLTPITHEKGIVTFLRVVAILVRTVTAVYYLHHPRLSAGWFYCPPKAFVPRSPTPGCCVYPFPLTRFAVEHGACLVQLVQLQLLPSTLTRACHTHGCVRYLPHYLLTFVTGCCSHTLRIHGYFGCKKKKKKKNLRHSAVLLPGSSVPGCSGSVGLVVVRCAVAFIPMYLSLPVPLRFRQFSRLLWRWCAFFGVATCCRYLPVIGRFLHVSVLTGTRGILWCF